MQLTKSQHQILQEVSLDFVVFGKNFLQLLILKLKHIFIYTGRKLFETEAG